MSKTRSASEAEVANRFQTLEEKVTDHEAKLETILSRLESLDQRSEATMKSMTESFTKMSARMEVWFVGVYARLIGLDESFIDTSNRFSTLEALLRDQVLQRSLPEKKDRPKPVTDSGITQSNLATTRVPSGPYMAGEKTKVVVAFDAESAT